MTRPTRFSSADLTRAVRAAEKAGLCVAKIRIEPTGAIEVVAGQPEEQSCTNWFAGSPLYRDKAA
jgi:hypothetical protein